MVERGSLCFLVGQLAVLAVAGCSLIGLPGSGPGPAAQPGVDYTIRGRIDWPGGQQSGQRRGQRSGQVLVSDLARGASVNLIDAATGFTRCATIATPQGEFVLSNCGLPEPDTVYILEAQKGLGGQNAGSDSVRLRTFIKLEGGLWRAIHASGITISPGSTALTIMQSGFSLKGKTDGSQISGNYIGVILAAGSPYDTVSSFVDAATFQAVTDMVRQALDSDADTVHAISYSGSAFSLTLGNAATVTEIQPSTTYGGNPVTIIGRNLSDPSSVTIGGKPCVIRSSAPTSVTVTLPYDAATGPLVVSFANGPPTTAVTYPVLTPISGRFKPAN